MKIEDFTIGTEFQTSTGQRWRCTDVGCRTILAIELDPDLPKAWFAGPPYAVPEEAFDEIEIRRAFRTIEEATRSALETVHKGTHPGYPSDVVAIMVKARAASASCRYAHSGLFRTDRVDVAGEILHLYAAEPGGDGWIIQVYLPFLREFSALPEVEFIQLRPATETDPRRQAPKGVQ